MTLVENQNNRIHMPKGQNEWYEVVEDDYETTMNEKLSAFVGKLEQEAKRRVDRRIIVEKRWLADLRQYHGKYDEGTQQRLMDAEQSMVFMNLTRSRTNRFIAKMWDLLFPTDDRNWAVNPTPVPMLTQEAEEAMQVAEDAKESFAAREAEMQAAEARGDEAGAQEAAAEMEQLDGVRQAADDAAYKLQQEMLEARKRCDLMGDEIEDQLKAARYEAVCRDVIEDAAKIGIGILKGPVIGDTVKENWVTQTAKGMNGEPVLMHVLSPGEDGEVPEVQRVDPWNFFPDPDYQNVNDGNGCYERELMNAKGLRRLAKMPGVDVDAIRRLLRKGATDQNPSYLVDLTTLTKQDTHTAKGQFHVWEYTGPVDHEDIELMMAHSGNEALEQLIGEGEVDPLMEFHAKIWFCQGEIIKFSLHPLDSNETIYSVFCVERDEASPFGFGIPYLLRDAQAVLSASWRKLMDNSGFATGPQIVVSKNIAPKDGSWTLKGPKFWEWAGGDLSSNGEAPFTIFNIPSMIGELQGLIEMARKEMNEIVDIGSSATEGPDMGPMSQTSGIGIALLLNAANIVYRRAVKNFDDDVSVPMIRRFYHWNMQFSQKDYIKGDYDVDARGSSVLLVREMMAQNLLMVAIQLGNNPRFADWIKDKELLDNIFRTIAVNAKEIVKSKREFEADMAAKAKSPEMNPELQIRQLEMENRDKDRDLEREVAQSKVAIAEMEANSRREVAQLNYEATMVALAEKLNMDLEELKQKLDVEIMKSDAAERVAKAELEYKDRSLATEVAMRDRTGKSSGGVV